MLHTRVYIQSVVKLITVVLTTIIYKWRGYKFMDQ
jgi:hypothetical protein